MSRHRTAARAITISLAAHAALNSRLLRRPPDADGVDEAALSRERISVLLPLRNEAHRVLPCLRALTSQVALHTAEAVEFVVLDDHSDDATADIVEAMCRHEPRMRSVRSVQEPPEGFLGKPWACAQLAAAADPQATVLVFVDADVLLTPHGLTRTVTLLRQSSLDFVSPYPRQRAESTAERLVQPLLQWTWLTFAPLRLAERTRRTSLALANGQLLAVDARSYSDAGGHAGAGVRGAVLEDLALARALRRRGHVGGMADGTSVSTCRMYESWPELRDGYSKSLWAAGGGHPVASIGQVAFLSWLYLRPDAISYAAGVASRLITARRTGGRGWPDALAHPASVALLAALTARSWHGRLTGRLQWKGRPVVAGPEAG